MFFSLKFIKDDHLESVNIGVTNYDELLKFQVKYFHALLIKF